MAGLPSAGRDRVTETLMSLVVALSRYPMIEGTPSVVRDRLTGAIDWASFLDLTARCGVQPVVFENLRTSFGDLIPPGIMRELRERERRIRVLIVSRTYEHVKLVRCLAQRSVEAIVLKGPAIGIEAYGSFERRSFGDVDLLVRKKNLAVAADELVRQGYQRLYPRGVETSLVENQHALEFSDGVSHVELHWTLFPKHLRLDFDVEELWREARSVECMNSAIRILGREHLLLYVCAHGTKHGWSNLRWVCDFAQLASGLTQNESARIETIAGRLGIKRILALGLRVVRDTFGQEPSFFPVGNNSRTVDSLASFVRIQLQGSESSTMLPAYVAGIHPYIDQLAFWMRTRERMRDRIGTAAMVVFIPSAGDVENGMVGIYRPFRLALHALRRRRALPGNETNGRS